MAKHERTRFLVPGCTRPDDATLETFYADARNASAQANLPDDFSARWIGADTDSTLAILRHIVSGDKTGTVSLPEVVEKTGQPVPSVGDAVVLIEFDGTPAVVVRITAIDIVPYGEIGAAHTALDGPRVRELEVWKPLHKRYFDMLLGQHGLHCTAQTPIAFESFELVYVRKGFA